MGDLLLLSDMPLISVERGSQLILDAVSPLSDTERLSLNVAHGRYLATDLSSDRAYPPYNRCMMDGICFSSMHESRTFMLRDTLHAGDSAETLEKSSEKPEAWRINTGAVVPAHCDTIVPVEELVFKGDIVELNAGYTPMPGMFIHREGSDVGAQETVLRAGQRLDSAALSIAASIGAVNVEVIKHPRVLVLTTGKEAIPPEESPSPHEIRRSHPTALKGAFHALGIEDTRFHHLSDHYEEMKRVLEEALSSTDLIITCGAISKGSSDYLRDIFRELCGEPVFHGVSQRPGKPLAFWAPSSTSPAILALPGNAISTLVTFHRYAHPALRKMMGHPALLPPSVTCKHHLPDFHLTRFMPVRRLPDQSVELHNPQNSGDFTQLAGTDGFVEIPLGTPPASPFSYFPWL